MLTLADPIISIKGLGEKTSNGLNQIGIYTLEHLLFIYQIDTRIKHISLNFPKLWWVMKFWLSF